MFTVKSFVMTDTNDVTTYDAVRVECDGIGSEEVAESVAAEVALRDGALRALGLRADGHCVVCYYDGEPTMAVEVTVRGVSVWRGDEVDPSLRAA